MKTEICNLALSQLGCQTVSDVDTETSGEAVACRQIYDHLLDFIAGQLPWGFATKQQALGLIEADPTDEWGYSYAYPSDCLVFRRILSGSRQDTADTRVPFRVVGDNIYTDLSEAVGEYTTLAADIARFPSDFKLALAMLIASHIAPQVTGGDPYKLGDRALKLYTYYLSKAQEHGANEEGHDLASDASWIRKRSI